MSRGQGREMDVMQARGQGREKKKREQARRKRDLVSAIADDFCEALCCRFCVVLAVVGAKRRT